MIISLYQDQIPRSTAHLENSLWWFNSIRTRSHNLPLSWRTVYDDLIRLEPDPTIYRSPGEQSMMISLCQDQIPRSTAFVENSLWWFEYTRTRSHDLPLSWRTVYDDLILPGPDPTIYRSRREQSWLFHSIRTRSHNLPLSWRTVYDDLIRPEHDPTIYRSRGEQSWWFHSVTS
jgi:hypothetical protein